MCFCVLSGRSDGLCSLTIDKALPEDEGQYMCRAESSAGRAECCCMVLVDGKQIPFWYKIQPNHAPCGYVYD